MNKVQNTKTSNMRRFQIKIPHARFRTDRKRFSFTPWRKKTDSVNKLEGGIIRKLWAKCDREQNPLKVNKNK